jgi:chromosome partitioning protein
LSEQVAAELRTHFGDKLFKTVIPRNVRLAEAPSFGKTIIMHDAIGKGSTSYLNLARELLQRNGLTKISDSNRMITVPEINQELNEDI